MSEFVPAGFTGSAIQSVFDTNDLGPGDRIVLQPGTYDVSDGEIVWGSNDGGADLVCPVGTCTLDGGGNNRCGC